jgi:hypothetical protein
VDRALDEEGVMEELNGEILHAIEGARRKVSLNRATYGGWEDHCPDLTYLGTFVVASEQLYNRK